MVSPARGAWVGFTFLPSTRISPSSIMLCRMPRETCGSCNLRKTSRRSNGRDSSTAIESVRLSMGLGGRGAGLGSGTIRKPEPKGAADDEDDQAGGLAGGGVAAEIKRAVIAAKAFDER